MKAIIRKAKLNDCASIFKLIKELALYEKEPKSVILNLSDIEKHGFGSRPLFQCIVAELANEIVGMALFYPRYSTWKGPTFHLEDLVVSENFKGKGIGTQLYYEFIRKSYEAGVERIEWNVLNWNTTAINFYKNSGANVLKDWLSVQMHRSSMKIFLDSKK